MARYEVEIARQQLVAVRVRACGPVQAAALAIGGDVDAIVDVAHGPHLEPVIGITGTDGDDSYWDVTGVATQTVVVPVDAPDASSAEAVAGDVINGNADPDIYPHAQGFEVIGAIPAGNDPLRAPTDN